MQDGPHQQRFDKSAARRWQRKIITHIGTAGRARRAKFKSSSITLAAHFKHTWRKPAGSPVTRKWTKEGQKLACALSFLARLQTYAMANILVVDDHQDVLDALEALLVDDGHSVILASSGLDGLTHAQSARPDVILLDIAMPEIDGIETLRRLKANPATRNIPVIMITAIGTNEVMVRCVQYGVRDYVSKPWETGEVEMVVRWALKAGTSRAAA